MKNEDNPIATIALPLEWMIKKLLGPTFDEVGSDLSKLYSVGRAKILSVAIRKSNVEDGKKANLRVTRDVFWNGSFTDEDICAEYFGGVLASSRSEDGKDDRGVFYTDIIKSLSSQQLLFHYIIYNAANRLWSKMSVDKKRPNVGDANELGQYSIWFSSNEIAQMCILSPDKDLFALNNKGLISDFESKNHGLEDGQVVPYVKVQMTTLGVQLYAVAHNKLNQWRDISREDFGEFSGIAKLNYCEFSMDDILTKAGLKKNEDK